MGAADLRLSLAHCPSISQASQRQGTLLAGVGCPEPRGGGISARRAVTSGKPYGIRASIHASHSSIHACDVTLASETSPPYQRPTNKSFKAAPAPI